MYRLIMAGQAETYTDAYKQACQLVPEVKAVFDQRKAEEDRKAEAARAAAARRAAGVQVPDRGSPPAASKPGTMDDTLRETYRRIAARS